MWDRRVVGCPWPITGESDERGAVASIRAVLADTRPLRNPHFRWLWLANIVTVDT